MRRILEQARKELIQVIRDKRAMLMALGIPPVATPIGSNPAVIGDGTSGFLADDDRQWQSSVERGP